MDVKFKVDREVLRKWVTMLGVSFTFTNPMHPHLQCLKFEVSSKAYQFFACDGYSNFQSAFFPTEDSTVDEEFEFLIDAQMLQKILSSSNRDKIQFQVTDTTVTLVTESKNKLPLVPVDTYPVSFPEAGGNTVEDTTLFPILNSLLPFVAKDVDASYLAGVGVSDYVYVGSTRMWGVIHKRIEKSFTPCILYPYTVKFVKSLVDAGFANGLKVSLTDTDVCFSGDSFRYSAKRPVDAFPFDVVHSLLEEIETYKHRIVVDNLSFHAALKRVLLLNTNSMSLVTFKVISNKELLLSYNNENGTNSSSESIEIQELFSQEEFAPFEFNMMIKAVDLFRKLFDGNEGQTQITFVDFNRPITIKLKGMGYLFYSVLSRTV